MEIENPGGILGGQSSDQIEGKSIRRNPLLADLLYRAGYGEKLGSGLIRIKQDLLENCNPPYQIAASNFFSIRFLPRISKPKNINFTFRQLDILSLLRTSQRALTSHEIAEHIGTSHTTVTRELKHLIFKKSVAVVGIGKSTAYRFLGH